MFDVTVTDDSQMSTLEQTFFYKKKKNITNVHNSRNQQDLESAYADLYYLLIPYVFGDPKIFLQTYGKPHKHLN